MRFLEEQQEQLERLDFDALDQDGKIDYLLLKNKLAFELREIAHQKKRDREIADLLPFGKIIVDLEESRIAMGRINPKKTAQRLAEISGLIEETKKELESALKEDDGDDEDEPSTGIEVTVAYRASRSVESMRQSLKDWNRLYSGYDPRFTWWNSTPYEKADKDLKDYADFLRKELAGVADDEDDPVIGDPIGRNALIDALQSEMIAYAPEKLIEIAETEFAWCEKEMLKASRDLGFGEDWRAAMESVKDQHVKPGQQPQLIKTLALETIEFLEERDLVTIPELCKEIWRMRMMTPERQKVTPYFTGGEVISVSYPTDGMTHEQKMMSMRGNNEYFSRATVQHELIPGHHMQFFMRPRHNSHRTTFGTCFWIEGWTLYWELLLWDLGFPHTPEYKIGMLFWRSHRAARIKFSLGFHLGQMTPQECVDLLVETVGHERFNAEAEVRRSFEGQYVPLYQAAYMLGGLQVMALKNEMVKGGKMTLKQFHDRMIRLNQMPIEILRAVMSETLLEKEFESCWRFYGDP
ncbi:MAG: DUF885 family protein [Armatimonadetes bacterium]|nr:DUF885 family protein [Armatimonadota bacterium]